LILDRQFFLSSVFSFELQILPHCVLMPKDPAHAFDYFISSRFIIAGFGKIGGSEDENLGTSLRNKQEFCFSL